MNRKRFFKVVGSILASIGVLKRPAALACTLPSTPVPDIVKATHIIDVVFLPEYPDDSLHFLWHTPTGKIGVSGPLFAHSVEDLELLNRALNIAKENNLIDIQYINPSNETKINIRMKATIQEIALYPWQFVGMRIAESQREMKRIRKEMKW